MSVLWIVLALVALQRTIELIYANRNTRALLARGAKETAPWQHPLFVALHASWLIAMALFIPSTRLPNWYLLAAFAVLQCLRVWVIASLGPFWTTRIISLPGAPLVRRGPYRWVHHPNYIIVAAEVAVLPLAFGSAGIAAIFSIGNAVLLSLRVPAEDAALSTRKN